MHWWIYGWICCVQFSLTHLNGMCQARYWVFLSTPLKQQHCTHHVCVSLFLLTQCLKPPNKRNSPCITTDSVRETYENEAEILRQKVFQWNRVFSNNTCRGIGNGRDNVMCTNVYAPLPLRKTAKSFYFFFFLLCIHCSYQYRRDMA